MNILKLSISNSNKEFLILVLGVKWRIEDITEKPEEVKKDLEQVFKQKSQKEWLKLMEGLISLYNIFKYQLKYQNQRDLPEL